MSPVYYKTMDGTTGAYGHGEWDLPRGKRPGKWMPKVMPVLCESGYHVCRDLNEVITHAGPELYEVEVRGACDAGDDKACYEQARLVRRIPEWDQRTMRLWAIDCARRVVYLSPDHELLDAVLDVCVAYVEFGEEWAAARAAAWAAARAAGDAARGAAWAAARAAARAAGGAAQDASWAAARGAARGAAQDASWAAARAAAWDAGGAETKEQVKLLQRYLDGEQGPFVDEGKP